MHFDNAAPAADRWPSRGKPRHGERKTFRGKTAGAFALNQTPFSGPQGHVMPNALQIASRIGASDEWTANAANRQREKKS